MSSSDVPRTVLPIPERAHVGLTTYDAKDPGHVVPADRAAASARGCAQRADRDDRRRRLRRVERVRRAVQHAERSSGWPANGLKFNRFHTTALCSPTRARRCSPVATTTRSGWAASPRSPPRRPVTTRSARTTAAPLAEIAEAERLQHRAVRQVPRGAGVGDEPDGPVRPVADRAAASSTSTASSAPRPTSGTRRSTTGSRRSSRRRRRRRATTSPRT